MSNEVKWGKNKNPRRVVLSFLLEVNGLVWLGL